MPGALLLSTIDLNFYIWNWQTKVVATVNTETATVRNCLLLKFDITLYGDIFKTRQTIDNTFIN